MGKFLFALSFLFSTSTYGNSDLGCWLSIAQEPLPVVSSSTPLIRLEEARQVHPSYSNLAEQPFFDAIPGYASSKKVVAYLPDLRGGLRVIHQTTCNLRPNYSIISSEGEPTLISTEHHRSQALILDVRFLQPAQEKALEVIQIYDPSEFIRAQATNLLNSLKAYEKSGTKFNLIDF